MPEYPESNLPSHHFLTPVLPGLAIVIAIGFLPIAFFGWKGIISAICLVIAGSCFVFGKRGMGLTIVLLLGMGQFFYPAINPAHEAILRSDCKNNLYKLTTAIHEYQDVYGHLPPPALIDEAGRQLHSWRVILLPFLGEQALYDQIDTTKPWNDPVNIPFHNQMPNVYCCPAHRYHSRWLTCGNTTSYIVVTGARTAWYQKRQISLDEIPDGTSDTIAIIESEHHRIPWMSPDDPELESFIKSIDFGQPHNGNLSYSNFDAGTFSIFKDGSPSQLTEMLKMDDGN